MAYQAQYLSISYNHANIIPETDSIYLLGEQYHKVFKDEATVMILAVQDEDFFEPEKYYDWIQMGNRLRELKGVEGVLSPGHFWYLSKNSELKKFETNKAGLDHKPTKDEADSLKQLFYSLLFYRDMLYNDSSKVYLMALTIDDRVIKSKKRESLVSSIESVVADYSDKWSIQPHFSGLPYTRTVISTLVREEIIKFIWLAMLVTTIILFIIFRSVRVVFFAMLIVSIAVIIAMGSMVLFGYEITIISGMIPPLIIVIGVPNAVYFLNKYQQEFKNHGNKIRAMQRVIYRTGRAALMTNLTTAVGFGTFILTQSEMLVQFGVITSINVMMIYLLSITLIPIIFTLLPNPSERQTNHLDLKMINNLIKILLHIVVFYRRRIIYIAVFISLICAIGITQMHTTGYLVDDIASDHKVAKDLRFLEDHFSGIMPLDVVIDTKKPRGVMQLSTIQKIEEFQQRIDSLPDLSKSISIADGVKMAKQAYYNGKELYYVLPNSQERGILLSYLSRSSGGSDQLKAYIDSTGQLTRVSTRIADVGSVKMKEVLKDLERIKGEIFPEDEYQVTVIGASLNFFKGTHYLINNLFTSLLLAIAIIAVLMALVFRTPRIVFISLLPNIIPLMVTAAVMGFFNIPIKPSTILVFSISFGISIDGTIHFLSRYRQALEQNNYDIGKSVIYAFREVGVSMIYTTVILFFGFTIFIFSDFGGTIALGLLVSLTFIVALFANLLLLPVLLLTMEKMETARKMKEPILDLLEDREDYES